MSALTADHVRSLAPDGAAFRAGQQLASIKKWSALGAGETVVWGEIQGSGSKPYQVRVDVRDGATKCSCPSRKLPCKHSLALMLIYCEARKQVPPGEPPGWVADWMEGREKRAKKASSQSGKANKPRDEEAAAKRAEQRESKVDGGVAELTLWMADLARSGMAAAREQPASLWDNIAARMVDAQAPGLARMVASVQSALFSGGGWQDRAVSAVGRLHLLLRAYRRLKQLSEPLQAEVRTLVGWTQDKQDVLGSQPVRDRWSVVGQVIDDSEGVKSRRTWLIGEKTQQLAMLLDFSVAERPFESAPSLGSCIDADVCFYAGAPQLRAVIREQHGLSAVEGDRLPGNSIAEALVKHAEALGTSPWVERWPMALCEVTPISAGKKVSPWVLRDTRGTSLPLSSKFPYLWELVAISGGRPISIFGEWDGESLWPLSTAATGRFFALSHSAGASTFRRIA